MRPGSCPAAPAVRSWLVLASTVLLATALSADELTLKNGTILEGSVDELRSMKREVPRPRREDDIVAYPIWRVETELQYYFISRSNVKDHVPGGDLLRNAEQFTLKQPSKATPLGLKSVGVPTEVTPFGADGRRTVTLPGLKAPIVQGIVKLTPSSARLKSLTGPQWETAIATSSIPPAELDAILRGVTKPNNPDHRLGIARFYMLAQRYAEAGRELDAISKEFPTLQTTVAEVSKELRKLQAEQILGELKLRRQAGQHLLVSTLLERFPRDGAAAGLLAEVDELSNEYRSFRSVRDQLELELGELEAKVSDDGLRLAVQPYRQEILERLHPNSLPRLDPFRRQQGLPVADRLALAISGWMLGGEFAVTELRLALRIGEARSLVLEYLRTEPADEGRRREILDQLRLLDGVGIERLAQLLPQLPPPLQVDPAAVGNPSAVCLYQPMELASSSSNRERESRDETQTAKASRGYHVTLPPEYSLDRRYPVILCLHAQGGSAEQEMRFWAGTPELPGQAQRYGYIVVSPDYATANQATHDYRAETHQFVLDVLTDVRRRFAVDGNRVFLVGHGMGGDAVFDIGFSHPDLFAGLIPMGGVSDRQCQYLWENVVGLPMYIVGGELDRDTRDRNSRELDRFFKDGKRFDAIYCEFRGAGFGPFNDELLKLFAWMRDRSRRPLPNEFSVDVMRSTDRRAWWLSWYGLPAKVMADQTKSLKIEGTVSQGNTIRVQCRADRVAIWLSPAMIDFEKRITVKVNQSQKWNDFVTPDVGALLEDLRRRGDASQPAWAVLEF